MDVQTFPRANFSGAIFPVIVSFILSISPLLQHIASLAVSSSSLISSSLVTQCQNNFEICIQHIKII